VPVPCSNSRVAVQRYAAPGHTMHRLFAVRS
jgi:hypothetical protein